MNKHIMNTLSKKGAVSGQDTKALVYTHTHRLRKVGRIRNQKLSDHHFIPASPIHTHTHTHIYVHIYYIHVNVLTYYKVINVLIY
jgi:hypothetical protein